jgi:hypothetical protein
MICASVRHRTYGQKSLRGRLACGPVQLATTRACWSGDAFAQRSFDAFLCSGDTRRIESHCVSATGRRGGSQLSLTIANIGEMSRDGRRYSFSAGNPYSQSVAGAMQPRSCVRVFRLKLTVTPSNYSVTNSMPSRTPSRLRSHRP